MGYIPTMGSLFSGIGGFEIAAQWHGCKVLWQSEIEPWAVQLLQKRFPDAVQLGDIKNIDGSKISPVDFITFGSPCQDMSVAGKRAGLDGERSGLFYQAVRIIKEMRKATNGEYPKYIIWENVGGSLSSNKGNDFRTVLEEITEAKIPMPKSGRWANAGMVRGGECDVSWRVLDAQYWGVPQRRKRIYLVGDYRGQRSAEILFKPEGVSRYPAPCSKSWEETAADIRTSIKEAVRTILNDQGGSQINVEQTDRAPTLRAQIHGHLPVVVYGICSQNSNSMKSDNPYSGIYEAETMPIMLENHPNDSRINIDDSGKVQTLTQRMGTGGNNVPMVMMPIYTLNERQYALTVSENTANTLTSTDYKGTQMLFIQDEPNYIVRRLTTSECAKIQGFPPNWHEGIINEKGKTMPDTATYKGYGNAVATVCAEYPVANVIKEIIKEHENNVQSIS